MSANRLSQLEREVLTVSCDSNERILLMRHERDQQMIYKSRFLALENDFSVIVIDSPSADSAGARPLAKGDEFEVFFECKSIRYLFVSRVLEHSTFRLQNRNLYAMRIQAPTSLRDGERREYFRVEIPVGGAIKVKFHIYRGGKVPVMSALVDGRKEEFDGEMQDISGGGFALRTSHNLEMEKGDWVETRFRLRSDAPPMTIWGEVRNKRRLPGSDSLIWGVFFLGDKLNPTLKQHRNLILRYVLERQREMLLK